MSIIRFLIILSASTVTCRAQSDPPVLSEMVSKWPYPGSFTLEGDLNGVYVIESSTNLVDWTAFTVDRALQAKRTILWDNSIWRPRRFFRAWRLKEPIFRYALGCFTHLDINSTGTEIDSFDSSNPAYSTSGRYDPLKRKDGGNVAVGSNLIRSLDIGSAIIRGRISPVEALDMTTNASVGSLAWVEAGNTGIEPGWISNDDGPHMYLAVPPSTNAPLPPAGIVDGTNYAYVLETGNYFLPSLDSTTDGRMRVVGNAALYIQGNARIATEGAIQIDPGASLRLYIGGNLIDIIGNGVVNMTGNVLNFQLYALNRVHEFSITSYSSLNVTNGQSLIGAIHAPDADFLIQCLGGTPFHFTGAVVGRVVRIWGPFKLHFDENLLSTLQR